MRGGRLSSRTPMLGLVLAGTEFALRGVDSAHPLLARQGPTALDESMEGTV